MMESEERPSKLRKLEHNSEITNDSNLKVAPTDDQSPSIRTDQNDAIAESDRNESNKPDEAQDTESAAPKLSKNQLKKQRRLERWEAGRDDRKEKRKEKIKAKKERRREEWRQINEEGDPEAADGEKPARPRDRRHKVPEGTQLPITVIFDCDFEDLMFDNELKSLGLQITRCYSDNRKAPFRTHLALSSFGGKMKERFDGILAKQYTSWKGFRFFSEDFVSVAEQSKEWMVGERGGTLAGALVTGADNGHDTEDSSEEGEIVYLSSESENTLDRLKPNSTYIIGGLVDKNRHKGLCHKRAVNRGIKTAKLPIGEFLHMKSRQVLVTNHVLEIMLRWMEFGDWGKAFMAVLPKRKGGVLKSEYEDGGSDDEEKASGSGETPIHDVDEDMNATKDDGATEQVEQPKNAIQAELAAAAD